MLLVCVVKVKITHLSIMTNTSVLCAFNPYGIYETAANYTARWQESQGDSHSKFASARERKVLTKMVAEKIKNIGFTVTCKDVEFYKDHIRGVKTTAHVITKIRDNTGKTVYNGGLLAGKRTIFGKYASKCVSGINQHENTKRMWEMYSDTKKPLRMMKLYTGCRSDVADICDLIDMGNLSKKKVNKYLWKRGVSTPENTLPPSINSVLKNINDNCLVYDIKKVHNILFEHPMKVW